MTFYIFEPVWITLTMPDDTTREFQLEAPNARQDAFQWGFRIIQVQSDYEDSQFSLRKGYKKYRHVVQLNYDWHLMPIHLLLVAKSIEIKHPPGFGSTDHYLTVACVLENEEALKSYQSGLSGAMPYADSAYNANRIKSGALTLNFAGITPLEWNEVEEIYLNQNYDTTHLTGDSDEVTADSNDIIIHE